MKMNVIAAKGMLYNSKKMANFIGTNQRSVLFSALNSEENQFFSNKIGEIHSTVSNMPKVYESDGQGKDAIVHLHYFLGDMHWYITERDNSDIQFQAFGFAAIGGFSELGYISIHEIIENGAELDLYWIPETLGGVMTKHD